MTNDLEPLPSLYDHILKIGLKVDNGVYGGP